MKNLKAYSSSSIQLHKDAVNKKHKGERKDRLIAIEDNIVTCFDDYDNHFNNDQLIQLTPKGFDFPEKDDLNSLYSYDSETIAKFRSELKKKQSRGLRSTCQHCTINSVNTLDHIIPQGDFPEFSVNPKNLIPCCSVCNSKKSNNWKKNDELLFLNLYIDKLPEKQYLFLKISGTKLDDIDFEYYLENKTNIDKVIYSRIESHFSKLNLLKRMKEKACDEIDSFIAEVESHLDVLTKDKIVETVTEEVIKLQNIYGHNHWKPVLKLELINNDDFWEWITIL